MILSPHLDDAALSAFSLISNNAEPVINVFAGVPPVGTLSLWDRLSGATCSRVRALERIEEDRKALAAYGVTPTNLDYVDALTRIETGDVVTAAGIAAALLPLVATGTTIYAPLGGGPRPNPDHEIVRDAAHILAAEYPVDLVLYADHPYCYKSRSWPWWISGEPQEGELPRWWRTIARRARLTGFVEDCDIWSAGAGIVEQKLYLMKAYGTQYEALNKLLRTKDLLRDPALYGWEVFWDIDKGGRK